MINERPSLQDQDAKWTVPRDLHPRNVYESMMRVQKSSSAKEDLLQCFAIVARMHLVTFRQKIAEEIDNHRPVRQRDRRSGRVIVGKGEEYNHEYWEGVRRELASFQNSVRAFSRFTAQGFSELEPIQSLSKIRKNQEDAMAEAESLESEIRYILQMNTSRLALVESRDTIAETEKSEAE